MVHRIYIVKNLTDRVSKQKIIKIEDCVNNISSYDNSSHLGIFEFTINMEDLELWSIEQFYNKKIGKVIKEIEKVLNNLNTQGYIIGIPPEDFKQSINWFWGHNTLDSSKYTIEERMLDNKTRTEILMWWLNVTKEYLENYDKNLYLVEENSF